MVGIVIALLARVGLVAYQAEELMDYLYSMGYSFIVAAFLTAVIANYLVEHEWY